MTSVQQRCVELLAACGGSGAGNARAIVFVAHPDDETIGLGAHLAGLDDPLIVHATDGAPPNLIDARAQGFENAGDYAGARRGELTAAMSLAGVGAAQLRTLGAPDQEASNRLVELTGAFAAILAERRPEVVFTHAYEGGHPDHDAVAFVARAARARMESAERPLLIEMPLYHSERGQPVRQDFAPGGADPYVVALDAEAKRLKQRMYACFATQLETIALFHAERETFRRAAPADFSAPPNGGEIFYESFGWGRTGAEFVARARAALAALRLPARL